MNFFITGGSRGIGAGIVLEAVRAGHDVAFTYVRNEAAAKKVIEEALQLRADAKVRCYALDVADADAIDELADRAFDERGGVHLLCNNAGVGGTRGGPEFINSGAWEWVMNVNFWGVVHGHRAFVPRMIEQGEGHVVNTASMAGHLPGHSPYSASKWAVVAITHGLYNDMVGQRTGIGVSCLCPGWVRTDIATSDRNSPESAAPPARYEPDERQRAAQAFVEAALEGGMDPAEVADLVHDAVMADQFWIFTDTDMVQFLADKHDSIMQGRNPTVAGHFSLPD